MGGWFSSQKKVEKVENTGQVQNNVVVNDPVTIQNTEIIIMLGIITLIKIAEFIVFLYNSRKRKLKKKYQSTTQI